MNKSGRIEALCISRERGGPKTPTPSTVFVEGFGVEGDAHAGDWRRQVSILSTEDVAALGPGASAIPPGAFAENVLVSGLAVDEVGLGSRIRLGATAEVEITQVGKACHQRCVIFQQMGDCVMPRAGLFARVRIGGSAMVGDPVELTRLVRREALQVVVLTISDRRSRGEAEDTAGPAVAAAAEEALGAHIYRTHVIPDEQGEIETSLKYYCDGHSIDLVITAGGTGFAPRDVTPEAVAAVIERPTPGLDEAMRAASRDKTSHAALARGVSGIRAGTLILSLPGSERAAVENFRAVAAALAHGLAKLRGDPRDCG